MITPEEFSAWKSHPVTKKILKLLHVERETLVNEVLLDSIGSISDSNMMRLGDIAGRVKATDAIINITSKEINDFFEVDGDDNES